MQRNRRSLKRMFEHFTEKARRVIFFARHEASTFGSREITAEHLLLGLLRENLSVANQYFHSPGAPESIRKRLEEQLPRGEKLPTSADLPLSVDARRVLAHAIEASIRLKHKDVTPAHLLMGLVQLENSLAARVLRDHEVTIPEITEKMPKAEFTPQSETLVTASAGSVIAETCRDLTAAAEQAAFPPLIGREYELQTLMQVLGRRSGNNPVLVGEPGVGKTTIVEALAQRIADHRVPEFLREKRILALAPGQFADSPDHRREFERRFRELVAETAQNLDLILFIDGLFDSSSRPASPFAPVLGRLLAALSFSQCIATGTPAGFKAAIERDPVIERHFRAIPIAPPGENDTIRILAGLNPPGRYFQ